MTRGRITIEKSGNYMVYDANTDKVHGVSTITTQSFNDAIRRSKRPIMMWRFREEVIELGDDVLQIDPEMCKVVDAWEDHFNKVTKGGFISITGVFGQSSDQLRGAVGINFSSNEEEARAAVAGMLMLGPMSRQDCMIVVVCNDKDTSDINEHGTPCLYVYREEPDDTETIDSCRIVTNHYSNAEPIEHFPMHDKSVFDALGIEYDPNRILCAWNYRASIAKSRAPKGTKGQIIIDFDTIFGYKDMPDETYEYIMNQIHNGVDIAEACEAANAAAHVQDEQNTNK